jgi:hypothetical protein
LKDAIISEEIVSLDCSRCGSEIRQYIVIKGQDFLRMVPPGLACRYKLSPLKVEGQVFHRAVESISESNNLHIVCRSGCPTESADWTSPMVQKSNPPGWELKKSSLD